MVLGILTLSHDYNESGDLGGILIIVVVGVLSIYCYSMYLNILDGYKDTRIGFSGFINKTTKGIYNVTMKCLLIMAVWGIIIPHLLFLKELMEKTAC